ncbi:hypothetical protein CUMW_095140 [Citrus unshiu]|uniref:non-specific serine/threonine protein kinase n=1 Tax=Citrus unshiu TaxID=55188 RepID=A0A2H5P1F4_CITUN|nr:hypothetical protein CUMW_095140 [Citrus unshiu]
MGFTNNIGKYRLGRTIGVGTFAKVKLGVDTSNDQYVAIKIIDKRMVLETNLKIQREITTMKLFHHLSIVRIHEVIGSKTKIYIVMEYVSGGQLSDKLSYVKILSEAEARKLFQQLIDAVDYCHNRGVYHRDLKPENLLLDGKGNLKVYDFGLSALQKPGGMLTTACGSPCYVAPELLASKGYERAAADIWSCGVILFELLAGYLPFDDRNLMVLYKKIGQADYKFPHWFTESQTKLISRTLDPSPVRDRWFQTDYKQSCRDECDEKIYLDDVNTAFESMEENGAELKMLQSPSFINAFQLIAMSHGLDLSGLFERQASNKIRTRNDKKETIRLGSKLPVDETIKKIEAAAMNVSLSVEKMNNFKSSRKISTKEPHRSICLWQVIGVAPTNCVVEISKSAVELRVYKESTSLLTEKSDTSPRMQVPEEVCISSRSTQKLEWYLKI